MIITCQCQQGKEKPPTYPMGDESFPFWPANDGWPTSLNEGQSGIFTQPIGIICCEVTRGFTIRDSESSSSHCLFDDTGEASLDTVQRTMRSRNLLRSLPTILG